MEQHQQGKATPRAKRAAAFFGRITCAVRRRVIRHRIQAINEFLERIAEVRQSGFLLERDLHRKQVQLTSQLHLLERK